MGRSPWHAHATQRAARGHDPVWITHASGPGGTVTKVRHRSTGEIREVVSGTEIVGTMDPDYAEERIEKGLAERVGSTVHEGEACPVVATAQGRIRWRVQHLA